MSPKLHATRAKAQTSDTTLIHQGQFLTIALPAEDDWILTGTNCLTLRRLWIGRLR